MSDPCRLARQVKRLWGRPKNDFPIWKGAVPDQPSVGARLRENRGSPQVVSRPLPRIVRGYLYRPTVPDMVSGGPPGEVFGNRHESTQGDREMVARLKARHVAAALRDAAWSAAERRTYIVLTL